MRKITILFGMLLFLAVSGYAQVAINTDGSVANSSAILDVKSTAKGILLPRMTMAQRDNISSPATGLTIYQTDNTPGYYYNTGTPASPNWVRLSDPTSGWNTTGNAGTTSGTNFVGTTDAQDFDIRTNDTLRTRITQKGQIETFNTGNSVFIGEGAGNTDDLSNNKNIFIGYQAGYSNTTGYNNTASGYHALYKNTTGKDNTAFGYGALYSDTTGYNNTANGLMALYKNTTGKDNTACGYKALYSNTTGNYNTACGHMALYSDTTGYYNTACGDRALYSDTKGKDNTASGYQALYTNTTGNYNTVSGYKALYKNTTGNNNTAIGYKALYKNTTGYGNTAYGTSALYNNTTGKYNTAIGYKAGPNGNNYNNTTALGNGAVPDGSNKVFVGNSDVTWIGGEVTWSTYSDKRIKTDIKEDVKGLDFILKLKPVTYHIDKNKQDKISGVVDPLKYKEKYAIEKIKFSGFLAQDVEQAAKESGYEFSGITKPKGDSKLYSISYSEFVVPLVKAVQEQQQTIKQQQKQIETLKKQNEEILMRLRKLGDN